MIRCVEQLIDTLFADIEMNPETEDIRTELINNCDERYSDLIAGGATEAEALAAVRESLKGMEEVMAAYPRRQPTAHVVDYRDIAEDDTWTKAERAEEIPEVRLERTAASTGEEADVWTGTGVIRLQTELRECDLIVTPAADAAFHVSCIPADCAEVVCENGVLTIRRTSAKMESRPAASIHWNSLGGILTGVMDIAAQGLDMLARNLGHDGLRVTVQVPHTPGLTASLHSMSGDIRWDGVPCEELAATTSSGDIRLKGVQAEHVTAKTTSGDIEAAGFTGTFYGSTMSGDVDFEGHADQAEINAISGDIEINGDVSEMKLCAVSGDIDVETESLAGQINAKTTSGDIEIRLPAQVAVNASLRSVSGEYDNETVRGGTDASWQVHAGSTSGDIHVW